MKKLDLTIAHLRLRLADIEARMEQIRALRRQYEEQFRRVVNHSLYGEAELDRILALMQEIEERRADVEATARRLEVLEQRTRQELDSLQITKGIEEAKAELLDLQARKLALDQRLAQPSPEDVLVRLRAEQAYLVSEMRRLQQQIAEGSELAARALNAERRPA